MKQNGVSEKESLLVRDKKKLETATDNLFAKEE
jgi:hypothetical protein